MLHRRRVALTPQGFRHHFRDGDGAVLPARATDRHHQLLFALLHVLRQDERQELRQALKEIPRHLGCQNEIGHAAVCAG